MNVHQALGQILDGPAPTTCTFDASMPLENQKGAIAIMNMPGMVPTTLNAIATGYDEKGWPKAAACVRARAVQVAANNMSSGGLPLGPVALGADDSGITPTNVITALDPLLGLGLEAAGKAPAVNSAVDSAVSAAEDAAAKAGLLGIFGTLGLLSPSGPSGPSIPAKVIAAIPWYWKVIAGVVVVGGAVVGYKIVTGPERMAARLAVR